MSPKFLLALCLGLCVAALYLCGFSKAFEMGGLDTRNGLGGDDFLAGLKVMSDASYSWYHLELKVLEAQALGCSFLSDLLLVLT